MELTETEKKIMNDNEIDTETFGDYLKENGLNLSGCQHTNSPRISE